MKGTLLIIGCGSIGRRHAQNAQTLGLRMIVCDADIERAKELAKEVHAKAYYADYQEAYEKHSDISAAVVATPSGFHIEQALFLAQKGIHLFIEKPLAVTMKGIDTLLKTIDENKVIVMIGQSYRFHEGYLALKKLLDDKVIGSIYYVDFWGGQYLPDWHPDMDYRTEYAAQEKLGGGVLFTSMSHMFDSVQFFFGEVVDLSGWKARLSDLEIDVEDSVFCLIKTARNIIVQCQSNFLQRSPEHRMMIVGEHGTIDADFVRHTISLLRKTSENNEITSYAFEPNKRYIEELKHFLSLVANGTFEHDLDIHTGIRVVELITSNKISAITKI